ncbi:hypothetical protein CCICO_06750 [Corynebacterium ciconiae DSM 44920]|uniref:DUF418 domain-containing protein n=2 Tax=Corynebacterium ciconiae TaxID=227319 RepID=UPI00036F4345|nr:DUF418 domain-containing protein [Corynebacterium ciconiae]WKD61370.1 hypothetical protein CCICO_06750 [Corynebacterium ciconiae DSM 44920]
MSHSASAASAHSPIRSAATTRMLAPDLARGFTLLGIAIANLTTTWLAGPEDATAPMLGGVVNDSTADKVAVVLGTMFAHVRGLPMFSTMLGFGVGLIALSLASRGYPLSAARKTIALRYMWLTIFGAVHMVFLFFGDIMTFYGLAGMLLALLINFRDKPLLIMAGVLSGLWIVGSIVIGIVMMVADTSMDVFDSTQASTDTLQLGTGVADSYLSQLGVGAFGLVLQPFTLGMELPMLFPLMLVGFVWARRGVLTHPEQHRRTLITAATAAVVVMFGVGLPAGLNAIGVLGDESNAVVWMTINNGLGVITGPGIVAIIALACAPLQRRISEKTARGLSYSEAVPVWIAPIAALGQRSMSGYVAQSVLASVCVATYGLGWGQESGAAVATGLAAAIWAVTVVAAYILQLLGRRGPLETLHRRMAYGKQGLAANYWAEHPQQHPSQQIGAAAAPQPTALHPAAGPVSPLPAPPVLPPRYTQHDTPQESVGPQHP